MGVEVRYTRLKEESMVRWFFAVICCLAPASAARAEFTVCDLFADPARFDRRQVMIDGELLIGDGVFALGSADCRHEYVTTLGDSHISRSWPIAISLSVSPALPVEQRAQIERATTDADRLRASGRTVAATARFGGDFHLQPIRDYPAWLVITSVAEIHVEPLPDAADLPVISICEIFKNLPSWNGKRVAIRAAAAGTFEGSWLSGDCSEPFETNGLKWPTTLVIGVPDYYSSDVDQLMPRHPAPAQAPDDPLRGRNSVVRIATHVGRIRARAAEEYSLECGKNGVPSGNGFGHLSAAPAEFFEEAVFDLQLRPAPKRASDDGQDKPCTPANHLELCADTTTLAEASELGCLDRARKLLAEGGIDSVNGSESAALRNAILRGDQELVRLLLDHGAPVDPYPRPVYTPLEQAAFRSKLQIMHMLIDAGAVVDRPDDHGQTYLAVNGCYAPRAARILIEAGAEVNARDQRGMTALMHASRHGYEESIRMLLEHGADVNLADHGGETALMHAAKGPYVDAIPILLAHGADLFAKDSQGKTALDLARENERIVAVEMLSAAIEGKREQ